MYQVLLPILSAPRNATSSLLDTNESTSIRQMLKTEVLTAINASMHISECGDGLWYKIVNLNMSNKND